MFASASRLIGIFDLGALTVARHQKREEAVGTPPDRLVADAILIGKQDQLMEQAVSASRSTSSLQNRHFPVIGLVRRCPGIPIAFSAWPNG